MLSSVSPGVTLCPCALTHATMAFLACKSPHLMGRHGGRELPPSVCACVCVCSVSSCAVTVPRDSCGARRARLDTRTCVLMYTYLRFCPLRASTGPGLRRQVLVSTSVHKNLQKKKFRLHKPNQICKTIWFHTILLQRLTSSTPAPTCGSPSLAALRGSRAATSGSPVLRCAL